MEPEQTSVARQLLTLSRGNIYVIHTQTQKEVMDVLVSVRFVSSTQYVVEVVSNTSTVALRVVGGDEKGTQCLGRPPCSWGCKYRDLYLQVRGVSDLRQ
jgi:hypothetical protein